MGRTRRISARREAGRYSRRWGAAVGLALCAAAAVIWALGTYGAAERHGSGETGDVPEVLAAFAEVHDLHLSDYPESVVELLRRNPETEEFVLNYPLEYGKKHEVDLAEYENSEAVPLFMQWDRRWGYLDYGQEVAAVSGCGPVCLSMAGFYVTGGEEAFRPDRVIRFALKHGYCVPGNGSSWSLISEGGTELGLDVTEIPLDEERIVRNLEVGNPIVCIMGPGDFTTSGHYIVLSGLENGKLRVNDPNSLKNSEKLWKYTDIQDQIRNLWVIRA